MICVSLTFVTFTKRYPLTLCFAQTASSTVISRSFLARRIYLLTKQAIWPIILGILIITGVCFPFSLIYERDIS